MKQMFFALLLAAAPVPAPAQPPLSQFAPVTDGLIAVGMALELSETCADLSPRTLRGLFYLNGLKQDARAAGYTEAQIEAYVADETEKSRLEQIARDRLAALGVQPGDAASHCRVGRAQIAAGTAVGRLLAD